MNGSLYLILGSMYSGKTTKLIKIVNDFRNSGKIVSCITSSRDVRSRSSELKTNNKLTMNSLKVKNLIDVDIPDGVDIIVIDEAQFFDDLLPFVKKNLERNFEIIVAGLDGDYKQEPIGQIYKLISIADTYEKLYAVCNICGNIASFTKRISTDNSKDEFASYISVCKACL